MSDTLQGVQWDDEKYGTPGQQALAAAEGLGQGFAGPISTGLEAGLSKLGVPGLTPQDQAMRAQTNPATHYGSQIAGFGAGLASGVGEGALVGRAGEAAASAAGLGSATLATRLATQGIKTGTEVAALQAGDEMSKAINQDPAQTLGSAAINVGLAGLLGGAGGAALGVVSDLWMKGLDKADGLINDAKARVAERQAVDAAGHYPLTENLNESLWGSQEGSFKTSAIPEASVGKPAESVGTKLGDWIYDKGGDTVAKGVSETVGSTAGALGGALVGHPLFGAYIGEKTLTPLISSLAKPMLENMTDGAAMKAAVDYVSSAIKGTMTLNTAVSNVFKAGEVLAPSLLPTSASRASLEKSLDHISTPENALNVGGQIGHYLPQHNAAFGALAGSAKTLFDGLRPKQIPATPFNQPPPPQPAQRAAYNRALDIAQQPLVVLQHVKNGTLLPQDVTTIQTLYPGLHKAMSDKLTQEMISQQAKGQHVPYHIRVGLQNLMGSTPLDGTLTQPARMAIMQSQAQQQANNQMRKGPHGGASTQTQKTVDKTTQLFSTRQQAREAQLGQGK